MQLPRWLLTLHDKTHPTWNHSKAYPYGFAPMWYPFCRFLDWISGGQAHD